MKIGDVIYLRQYIMFPKHGETGRLPCVVVAVEREKFLIKRMDGHAFDADGHMLMYLPCDQCGSMWDAS
jgi:hypothetical protein